MPIVIRLPTVDEWPALGDLCMRSKAVWGYDKEFMEACQAELSFDPCDLQETKISVAVENDCLIGVAQVKTADGEADLVKLFVDPAALRRGVGQMLFAWAADVARDLAASRLVVEADPNAAPFYRRMGAHDVGIAPSGSIPGRMLPKLALDLHSRM